MAVKREIEIARPIEEVFAFLADARNDPRWCPTVLSCEQLEGEGPAAGARYLARHKPTPFHRVMDRSIEVVGYRPPDRIEWRQEDGNGVFHIVYGLDATPRGTRFTQADEIAWKVPRAVGRIAEHVFVRRHIDQQMRGLRRLLEAGTAARIAVAS